MKIINITKILVLNSMLYTASLKAASSLPIYQYELQRDIFEYSITPQGVKDTSILKLAPKPDIVINGEKKKAGIIVDISTNILYRYDKNGNPINAYLIASGKKSTPTDKGVRIVTHKETFPYRGAPRRSKRRRAPRDYGPMIICLNKIDPKTGEQSSTGEFIHGCRSYEKTFESTPDRYVSHGCMRMDNEVIKALAPTVEKGEIVIIK
jgi:lipoprotein-anchoring transpeptidase ErfK/SrfK